MNVFHRKTSVDNNSRQNMRVNNGANQYNDLNHQPDQQVVTSIFSNVLETMDRFLEKEDNLLVQALVTVERRTNISKRYLARIVLILIIGYLIFSYSFLDFMSRIIMFLYPSYRSFRKLKYSSKMTREEMIQIIKFWTFMSFFSTADLLFGSLIPLGFFLKGIILVQCVIPQNPPAIDFAFENIVKPVYNYLENNDHIRQLNQFFQHIYDDDNGRGGEIE